MDSKHLSRPDVATAAGLSNPEVPVAFARALQARVHYAMAICSTDERSAEHDELLTRARYGARDLGRDLVLVGANDLGCPLLLADVPMLCDAFAREVGLTQLEQADWDALDLPTPDAFVQALTVGQSVDANGHLFEFVSGDGLWCTNPYGRDAYFGNAIPSISYARELFSAIALGTVFSDSQADCDYD
ncbi:hypothetical protein [Burkholderia sp. BCC0322]|uniref:hypothetical protein n=1 Tax=unclassified Burkholderia TaxID=2613784 RepID=UPI00158938E8|nr:hypothetical protein [Burkholderia sp. BCC0322]